MNHEGPTLERLLRRLMETPSDFLAEPRNLGGGGVVHVPAVAADLLEMHGISGVDLDFLTPENSPTLPHSAGVALLLCWLLADPEFISRKLPVANLYSLLSEGAMELAFQNPAAKYREDSERREELIRYALARLDLRPAGELIAQAQDRLTTLSSIERNRVLEASRAAEQRAREIREALARQSARESADKYTRE